MFALIEVKDK